ncbi:F-box domain-containing protein [Colletotrichum graminicola]|uniref:F-box domain-containing protein n=1 Tax=Colletotrichum graminicola (strain M1.001 / M2 / FGSC 10212) TaxID=645133 RepID=E3QTC0_COLGM|nr:F-box domain-containing protein [Colletotrichum graminicola M1.001]EFQ34108.1 F-box domain-containing protein [Colletotrichum graminicola M1.001]WDK20883.1 F-box domain-containing protein [Colletotrichum graminicola]
MLTMSGPASPALDLTQPISQFSASLFAKLPAEIQLETLSYCQQNDLVCLSLSSHYFRYLTLRLIPKKPHLQLYDQNLPPEAISCACGNKLPVGVAQNPYAHRKRRHEYIVNSMPRVQSDSHICQHWSSPCRAYPPEHPMCRLPGCRHCMCISCPLYVRLRSWIGKELRYCSKCWKFTKREWTKKYNGRCLHGRPKVRRTSNNHWTAVKGRSYGDRWWNRWGTRGVDSWGFDDEKYVKGFWSNLEKRRNARIV